MEGYEIITAFIRPAYSYIEGDKKEHWWADSQNCYYYLICEETDDNFKRFDKKKFWIIEPYKPKGLIITKDNYEEVKNQIKWLVTDTSEENDSEKEWDFNKHCIK